MRRLVVATALLLAACATPAQRLSAGQRKWSHKDSAGALVDFDAAARRSPPGALRVEALVAAALACERLGRLADARQRLELAIQPEVDGASEDALFHLARLLEKQDRPRALNLYYRAAAGAEKHRDKGFPYHEATQRILQMAFAQ